MTDELVKSVITNFLETDDPLAKQYHAHRCSALEVSQQVQRELATAGEVSAATKKRLQQIQFDNIKMNVQYKAHVERLQRNFTNFSHRGQVPSLDEQIREITSQNEALSKELDKLAGSHKPVVEKLNQLVKNFESRLTIKNARANRTKAVAEAGDSEGDAEVLLSSHAAVFTRAELEALFGNVTKRLAKLKTVDEIRNGNDCESDADGDVQESQPIDVVKHLSELLENSRAYTRLEDGSYRYDISKSSSVDIGSVEMSLQEYAQAIDLVERDIQDLVQRGTEAKERWVDNARKIEMMQALLEDAMDVDSRS